MIGYFILLIYFSKIYFSFCTLLTLVFFNRKKSICANYLDDLKAYENKNKSIDNFIVYFNKNWYECKDMWVYCYRRALTIGNNNTNNRVESMNRLLKKFIKYKSKMSKCLQGILNFLNYLNEEMSLKQWNEK